MRLIPRGELFPDSIFGSQLELVREGGVTDRGMVELRSRMPYADLTDFEHNRSPAALVDPFTVDLLVRYDADWKLGGDDQALLGDRADARVDRESPAAH